MGCEPPNMLPNNSVAVLQCGNDRDSQSDATFHGNERVDGTSPSEGLHDTCK